MKSAQQVVDSVTVVSWNLQGNTGLKVGEVGDVLRGLGPSLVLLQEVQEAQVKALADRLGWPRPYWTFKHWPLVRSPEGLATLAPSGLTASRSVTLSHDEPRWSYRRRVAQIVEVELGGLAVRAVNTHLASHSASARLSQVERLLAALGDGLPTLLAGDLNEERDGPVLARFAAAGLQALSSATQPTNWHSGDPPEAPSQLIDHILGRGLPPVRSVGAYGEPAELAHIRSLSDHLPVVVTLGG